MFSASLKVVWWLTRTIWWLGVFAVLSVGAGMALLARRARPGPETTVNMAGVGQYSQDGKRWQDEASGQWYPCSDTDEERV